MNLGQIKELLRNGPYAWPGGYPVYFITGDGAALSFKAVRQNWHSVVMAHLCGDIRGDWFLIAAQINWEDSQLYCDQTGERIESAYAEDEVIA
jgi:hypothetical protein